jgi:hypothetical protein
MASFNARRPTSQIIYSCTWHVKFRVEKVCGAEERKTQNETMCVSIVVKFIIFTWTYECCRVKCEG